MKNVSNRRILVGTTVALVVNAALFYLGSVAGATWNVGIPFTVGILMVVGATVVPMLLGGQVIRLVGTRTPAIITLSAWLVPLFCVAGSPSGWIASNDVATGIALGAMHVVVGLAWFFSLKPSAN